MALVLLAASALAQDDRRTNTDKKDVTLTTKDGVQLKASYYPSQEDSKEAIVPVILLHDFKGSRHEYDEYARHLQGTLPPDTPGPSFAVIVPDLRGHGGSTQQHLAGGRVVELDATRLRRQDFFSMIQRDMEAVRRFLVTENNAGKLNLNKLTIVGAGMGATVGLNWTVVDWSAPPLATGKQGQDVKAVALISPQWSFNGVPLAPAMNHPLVRSRVDLFIAFGDREADFKRDAERIFNIAERFHPPYDPSQGEEKQEVFLFPHGSSLQGGELLIREPTVGFAIRKFIENRVAKQNFPWLERKVD
jgi:pimeloyl-ACP methyl ester carboxylesterase